MTTDFHPPLYHFIIHFWSKLGSSEPFLRLPSVCFGVATIYIFYLLLKELTNEKLAVIAAWLLALSPLHIYFSQELRMYSLSALLSTGAMLFFLRFYKGGKALDLMVLTIFTIFNLYTLYFSFLLVIAQLLLALLYFESVKKRQFFLAIVVSLFSFVFWLPKLYAQLAGGNWLISALPGWQEAASTPAWKAPFLILVKFFLGQIDFSNNFYYGLIFLVLLALFSLMLFFGFRSKEKESFALFAFWFFIPIFLAILLSLKMDVVSPKRLILTLPAFLGLLSLGIFSLKRKPQIIFLATFFLISLLSLGVYFFNPQFQREDWRSAVTYVEDNGNQNSLALFEFSAPFAPYLWYRTGKIEESRAFVGMVASQDSVEKELSRVTVSVNKIFLFQYLSGLTDPHHLVAEWLKDSGWVLKGTKDFPGVGFIYTYEKFF
jgi:uncharacterized membrane protein